MSFPIRPMRSEDASVLEGIEQSTHEQFRAIGLDTVADDPPDPIEVLVEYAVAGRAWVAVDDDDTPIGYLLIDEVDGSAHIDQVTVRSSCQGQGVGRALMDQAGLWASERGLVSVTLTTFVEVPWNRPLYEHLGFRVLTDNEIGPGLREVQKHEADKGFGPAGRVAMRLDLG